MSVPCKSRRSRPFMSLRDPKFVLLSVVSLLATIEVKGFIITRCSSGFKHIIWAGSNRTQGYLRTGKSWRIFSISLVIPVVSKLRCWSRFNAPRCCIVVTVTGQSLKSSFSSVVSFWRWNKLFPMTKRPDRPRDFKCVRPSTCVCSINKVYVIGTRPGSHQKSVCHFFY